MKETTKVIAGMWFVIGIIAYAGWLTEHAYDLLWWQPFHSAPQWILPMLGGYAAVRGYRWGWSIITVLTGVTAVIFVLTVVKAFCDVFGNASYIHSPVEIWTRGLLMILACHAFYALWKDNPRNWQRI